MQFYTDRARRSDPWALPNAEVFYVGELDISEDSVFYPDTSAGPEDFDVADYAGWYWWACFPGCLPDSEPIGPFPNAFRAIRDARRLVVW
jgi:hypothetical protein